MRWNRIDSWDQIKSTVTAGVGDDDVLTVRPPNLTTIDKSMPPPLPPQESAASARNVSRYAVNSA
ncbi:hypothetical protein [uncultured Nevskia sp.]|uniref:hypothetical protein n=1 Tax=uncultured Nevskia sp. TaxID=228950 RepID=UPI0025F007A2|nr:hypothetical protein [uncultured Nevskia sp.]